MGWKRVTLDIAIDYGLWEPADLMRWDMLVMELERQPHTLESLKESDAFYAVNQDFIVRDSYLKKLIAIHEPMHQKNQF